MAFAKSQEVYHQSCLLFARKQLLCSKSKEDCSGVRALRHDSKLPGSSLIVFFNYLSTAKLRL